MKSIKLFILPVLVLVAFTSFAQLSSDHFVTRWSGNYSGVSGSAIHIPVSSSYSYNYDVDWDNDGVFDDLSVTDSITHIYSGPSQFIIRIRGTFPAIVFGNSIVENDILGVQQWGTIVFKDFTCAFEDCGSLDIQATDKPTFDTTVNVSCRNAFKGTNMLFNPSGMNNWDMSSVTDMSGMFRNSFISTGVSSWDVSSVSNMSEMFWGAVNFINEDLSAWDVSNVNNMSDMFRLTDFVGDISTWNVSSVTDMSRMFMSKSNLTSSGTGLDLMNWDVSSVTSMESMFQSITDVSDLNIANWNVASTVNMRRMFTGTNLDLNLGNWDINSVTNMSEMLNGTNMSIANYDSTLIGWAQNTHQMNVNLGALNLEYCDAISARNQLLADGWTIAGDTTNCVTSLKELELIDTQVYPNPTTGVLYFENITKKQIVDVYSVQGRLVRSQTLENAQLDLSELKSGMYYIRGNDFNVKVTVIHN